MIHPEELASRTARWSVACGEVIDAARQIHSLLAELAVPDPEGDNLVALVGLIAQRAEPPPVLLPGDSDDDDDRDDDPPDPAPLPVIVTPSTTAP